MSPDLIACRRYLFRDVRMFAHLTFHYAKAAQESRDGMPNRCAPAYYERIAAEYAEKARQLCRAAYIRGDICPEG